MGKGFKKPPPGAKATQFKKGVSGNPKGRPPSALNPAFKRIAYADLTDLASMIVGNEIETIREFVKERKGRGLQYALASAFIRAADSGDIFALDKFLDRLVGRVPNTLNVSDMGPPNADKTRVKKTYQEFCEAAGYPAPFPKQVEMKDFIISEELARLLLGARGYGKTDYAVVLGLAYEIYEEWFEGWVETTTLIVTKSEERNAAMLEEIFKACEANGVKFEKKNSTCLRVQGLVGKDHSISTVTIGATSIRGRHPKRVVMDDPVTEEDVSEATRKRVQRVYNELNKLTQNVAVIGQPVHKSDLYETLRPLIKRMEVPHGAIPELDVDLMAMALAGVSQESISASYHLKVISENGSPFEKVKLIDSYPRKESSVAFIDPSFEGGDYTALSIATSHFDGVAVKGRVWKKAWNHCLDEIVQELLTCNVKRVCFETNCLGDQPVVMLRTALPEGIGVIGKKSTGFKHSRIMNAGAYAHLLFLAKSSDRKYIEQITQYEYGAKNDDAPDSLASLLEWLGLIRGKKV
jgi:hypothetical protein